MLSATERTQTRLELELATCKAAMEEAVARGDSAHSEAVSYLSKMRQQDRQAEIDRLEQLDSWLCFSSSASWLCAVWNALCSCSVTLTYLRRVCLFLCACCDDDEHLGSLGQSAQGLQCMKQGHVYE